MKRLFTVLCVSLAIAGCCQTDGPIDRDTELKSLQETMEANRQAHLNHDVEGAVAYVVDGVRYVDNGVVVSRSHDDMRDLMKAYFESTEILAWEDIDPPVIDMSDDCTMATAIVRKRLLLKDRDDPEAQPYERSYAWISTFRRVDGRWKATAFATTRPAAAN